MGKLFFCWLIILSAQAQAAPSPVYPGYVERIIDADTFRVSVLVWPTIIVQVNVRVAGIDAPESFRPKCAREKELAGKAKTMVQTLLSVSKGRVWLFSVSSADKYGRISAVVVTKAEVDIGAELLKAGLARPYISKGKRPDWCGEEKRGKEEKYQSKNGEILTSS